MLFVTQNRLRTLNSVWLLSCVIVHLLDKVWQWGDEVGGNRSSYPWRQFFARFWGTAFSATIVLPTWEIWPQSGSRALQITPGSWDLKVENGNVFAVVNRRCNDEDKSPFYFVYKWSHHMIYFFGGAVFSTSAPGGNLLRYTTAVWCSPC